MNSDHLTEDEKEQEAFDEKREAYITREVSENHTREEQASLLDTTLAEFPSLQTDPHFEFAKPGWNDEMEDLELIEHCDKIREKLSKYEIESKPLTNTISRIEKLLNCCFSERIKQHIVKLTAGTETVEGACRHCFGFYHEDSRMEGLGSSMIVWHTLSNIIGTAAVFNAFVKRAWHLNPISAYFPQQYKDLVSAVRTSELDKSRRFSVHYSDPYAQLEALNETFKELRYTLMHTDDAIEKSRIANSQVKVLGAMFVINNRLEKKHENAITDAEIHALNP